MSLLKNLVDLTTLPPKARVTWDKARRILRNREIWADPTSVVHRLPVFYQERYWKELLRDATPVHYRPPTVRFQWDSERLVQVEREDYPIIPIFPPEADQGLWGGEGVLKGYRKSRDFVKKKILPNYWLPTLWFPCLKDVVLYSEVLNKHMRMRVTERTMRLIDDHFGLDLYLLETADIDLRSKLGCKLKREILMALANQWHYPEDEERREWMNEKYARFILPPEEAEWVGLELNEACKKLQDLEEKAGKMPLKVQFERELVEQLRRKRDSGLPDAADDVDTASAEKYPSFVEKLFGESKTPKKYQP
uniref:Large ribosomal subunit protein bL28m n=1 Tax=Plectus sambesii TaxID=2011161 RepID=A0A914VUS5_9BILA